MSNLNGRLVFWGTLLAALCAAGACKKREAAHADSPAISSGITPERRTWLENIRQQEQAAAARDHAELVRAAPRGFNPRSAGAKLVMALVIEKARIKKGEPIRYRIEIQNVGGKPYTFVDSPHSFIKDGSLHDTFFKALLTRPGGMVEELDSPVGGMAKVYEFKLPNERFMTDEQKHAALEDMNRKAASERELIVTLQPGETLVSRGEHGGSDFRPLDVDLRSLTPGKYQLKIAFEEPSSDEAQTADSEEIERINSNSVSFEIIQ